MISEFGSLKQGGDQALWIENGLKSINEEFKEIKAIVLFNSGVDNNMPDDHNSNSENLDWTVDSFTPFQLNFTHDLPEYIFKGSIVINKIKIKGTGIQLPKKAITGVAYKKGQNWIANNYVLNRDVLIEDFDLMKKTGLNTIKYNGLSIYDSNVLNISREKGISLIFSFWVPNSIDFVVDHKAKLMLSKNILEKVKKIKKEEHIVSWNIGNDIWLTFK